jgi:hypothetical protein
LANTPFKDPLDDMKPFPFWCGFRIGECPLLYIPLGNLAWPLLSIVTVLFGSQAASINPVLST